jgi:DNA-binding beta-propeller fold protein YncE
MASNNVSVINAATNTVIGSPIPVGKAKKSLHAAEQKRADV